MSTGSRSDGFTLVEMAIGIVLLAVLGGFLALTTTTTRNAVQTGVAVSELDADAMRILDDVCDRLKSSSAGKATPQSLAPFSGTSVDFQRGLGADVDGNLVWGPVERLALEYDETANGLDDDGDGLVDEGRIVWTEDPDGPAERRVVLCEGVREYLEGETFDGTDENGNGLIDERGFALDFDTGRVTVRLTLETIDQRGQRHTSTVERSVLFRNEGS